MLSPHDFWRRVLVVAWAALLSCPESAQLRGGTALNACDFTPSACLRSLSLAESARTGMGLVGFPGRSLTLELTLTTICTSCPYAACTTPAAPTVASVSIDFYPGGAGSCPPPGMAPAFSFTGPLATPACSSNVVFAAYTVEVPAPLATPPGIYCAHGSVRVTYSDGRTLTASGETVVCIVEPISSAPSIGAIPRLGLTLISESAPRRAPGDMALARYLVQNNDPTNAVTLTAIATSRQSAARPQGGNEWEGVFAISNPFGEDFPIQFDPGTNCIPLPARPYIQQPISSGLPVIPPGGSNVVTVGIRSYGQCASGSCSASTLKVTGTFADGTPALACAGMALVVDAAGVPSLACGRAVNDCNLNGIPDALDIAAGRSQDRNYNALPDECEEIINMPVTASVTPTNPAPGEPIQVRVIFNEVVPIQAVWADGVPLVRVQIFGVPVWEGAIPADLRAGPQTVYFTGRDQFGVLSTYLAPYVVPPPLRITGIYLDSARNVIIEHNQTQVADSFIVQENSNLLCPTCWTNRLSGSQASPYNAGPATGTRSFRLRK